LSKNELNKFEQKPLKTVPCDVRIHCPLGQSASVSDRINSSMSDWDSLKAGPAFGILPGNIQHVGLVFAVYCLKLFQAVAPCIRRFTIDIDGVIDGGLLCGEDALDCFESNVNL
jgi:hypothetical protein